MARGLAYAHAKTDKDGRPLGIVHRDVSFKNIMLAFEGDVKLTDFGIAKARGFLTDQEGEVVAGKADYMSPEQADFQITDKRSDLFSAGVVLSHLLLGRNIFKGANADESRQRILNQPVPDFRALDSRVDDRLNDILHHRLTRDLSRRYTTADELMYDLEYYIYHDGYGPTNETLGKYIRELFGQSEPPAAAGRQHPRRHADTRTHGAHPHQEITAMKRAARVRQTRPHPELLLSQSRGESEADAGAGRAGRPTRRANHLHAGTLPLAVFLPERRPRKLQAGRNRSRPDHRRFPQAGPETSGGGDCVRSLKSGPRACITTARRSLTPTGRCWGSTGRCTFRTIRCITRNFILRPAISASARGRPVMERLAC